MCVCVCVCVCWRGEASVSADKTGNGVASSSPAGERMGLYVSLAHTRGWEWHALVCVCARVSKLDATFLVTGVYWGSTETMCFEK